MMADLAEIAWRRYASRNDVESQTRRALFYRGWEARAALTAREEPDSLMDFPEESLEELRDLVMPLEELRSSDRLLGLIDKALEVKRRSDD